ncbi:MAG: beta-propeller fold lactonase family protein [Terriglobales bacterium]
MSFLTAARAALAGRSIVHRILAPVAVLLFLLLVLLSISCGTSTTKPVALNHSAYVTLPDNGSVLQLEINGTTGAVLPLAQTPQVQGLSPTGVALLPAKNFLYAANSEGNTISIFSVAPDGTLTLTGTPVQAGDGPNGMAIDPTGSYLLVTNNFSNNIYVYQINSSTGALTPVGSPVPANGYPTQIVFTHNGNFVYVTNPVIGMVSAFTFASGVLTQIAGSPFLSAKNGEASGLVVNGNDLFLYVANPSASNVAPYTTTTGNISGFDINPTTGSLTPMPGSPYASIAGSGPSALVIDPTGELLYAITPGSTFSVWCFQIGYSNNGQLQEEPDSPFSVAAGGLFALFDPSGKYLYIGSNKGLAGYTYDPSSGAPTIVTGSPFSTTVSPGGMIFAH